MTLFIAFRRTGSCGRRLFSTVIDLRSDTVTRPSKGMRTAMMNAEVGDDVYGEDTTVIALQSRVCKLLGKEASLFVPSGTMSNLIAIGAHCRRGEEAILGRQSHIFVYEGGGASAFLGASLNLIENDADGTISEAKLASAVRPLNNDHYPVTKCIALENTHNVMGGVILPQPYVLRVKELCRKNSLALHLDGARLWNASVATGLTMLELSAPFDSVSVCLSKGLGAPVGSLLVGTEEYIHRARRLRKALGGGLRQSGVIAAAGLYALDNNIERLSEDHARAKTLAIALRERPHLFDNIVDPQTNILYFDVKGDKGTAFCEALWKRFGIKMGSYGTTRVRAVTHLDIDDSAIEATIKAVDAIHYEGF